MPALTADKRCPGKRQSSRPAVPLPILDVSALKDGTVKASRSSRWRAGTLILLHLLIIGHILHWRFAGRTLSPVEPSESMYTLQRGELNAGFIFFAIALLATLIFGRFVCGWGCHVVALQDLCAWLLKKMGLRPRAFRSRLLIFVPLAAALYMFVWPTAYRAGLKLLAALGMVTSHGGSVVPTFSNHLTTTAFWATFPSLAVAIPFLFICGFVTVYFLGSKGFCTYACPYGGFFGLADQFALGKIRVTDACNGCGHCTAVCTSNVQVAREVRDYGMVVDPGCMKCMDCVSVCPTDALYWGLGRPSVGVKPRSASANPRYELSWGEEIFLAIVFAVALVSLRGVYGAVPFLMALGSAAVIAYLALRLLHLFRRRDVAVQNFPLKSGGRMRSAGWVFGALAGLVLAFTIHSGVVNSQRVLGQHYYEQTGIPEEVVLDGGDWSAFLSPARPVASYGGRLGWLRRLWHRFVSVSMPTAIDRGYACYDRYDRWGLIRTEDTKLKLAWLSLLRKDNQGAARHLQAALALRPDQPAVRYQLASVHSLMGNYAAAIPLYESVVQEKPDLPHAVQAWFKLGNAQAEAGRLDAAVAAWESLLAGHPGFAPAHHNLAGALRQKGRLPEAIKHYEQAIQLAADDAEAHFQMGVTLSSLQRFEEASRHFERAVQLDPRYREFIEPPEKK